jgi:hypothetical protein
LLDRKDLPDPQGKMALTGRPVLRVHKVFRDRLDRKDQQALTERRDRPAPQVHKALLVLQVHKVLRVTLVTPDLLDRLAQAGLAAAFRSTPAQILQPAPMRAMYGLRHPTLLLAFQASGLDMQPM